MRFTWRAGLSFLILWALAVGHLAAGVPRNDPPDQKEKPVLIIAVLIGLLQPSCEPGRPVALLKVRVTNKSRVSTPALPASEGLEAQDRSTPPWRGTAALPALRPGQVVEVAIPLEPTSNLLPGKHEFQVTVNPRHVIEQEHYRFNSAGPLAVDIPTGFCRTASIRPGVEKLEPTNPDTGRSPNVPARPSQPESPRNEPPWRNDSAGQSATSETAAGPPKKQGLSITITPAAQAYTLAGSCVANKPLLVLHVRVTDTGTTQLPDLPFQTAILARDIGKPFWGGGAGLQGLSPGASEDRNISLYPPSRPQTVGGVHRFTVTTLGFSSAPIQVNIPANYCSELVLPNLSPKVLTMAASQANQLGRKNSVEDASKKVDVSHLDKVIQQSQTQQLQKNSALYQVQPLPVPLGLTSTTDPHACFDHAGVGGGFVCQGALPQGRMALIWNAPQQLAVDGYRVYRVDGGRTDHVGDQANGTGITFYMLAPAPGGPSGYMGQCYAVTSFRGSAESHPSGAHCVGGGEVIQTATFPLTEIREITHVKGVCNGIGGGTNEGYFDPGVAEVGYSHWDGGFQGVIHCWNTNVTRLGVKFDVSSLAGKSIRSAQLKLKVDTTDNGSGQDHHTSCLSKVGPGVDEWWNYTDWIAGDPSLNIGTGVGPDVGYDITPIVRNWIQYGSQNYGLVLMGADENMDAVTNSVCQTQYWRPQTSLEVQYQ